MRRVRVSVVVVPVVAVVDDLEGEEAVVLSAVDV